MYVYIIRIHIYVCLPTYTYNICIFVFMNKIYICLYYYAFQDAAKQMIQPNSIEFNHICIHISIYVYIYSYIYTYTYIYMYTYIHMYDICVCLYYCTMLLGYCEKLDSRRPQSNEFKINHICIHMCILIHIYIYIYTYIYICVYIHMCIYM